MLKSNADHQKLLEALKSNDKEAFQQLYKHFRRRLFVVAYLILKDVETTKDLVQDFFADFWENQRYNNINIALQTYLTHAIRNRAVNWKKKEEVISRLRQSADMRRLGQTSYPIEDKELNKQIYKAINQLPPMALKVFEMHYIDRLSHNEISEHLGISKSTISSHLDRALKELRNSLKIFYKNSRFD
jgi:RNA polymerase sigma-70 factor (family 1)